MAPVRPPLAHLQRRARARRPRAAAPAVRRSTRRTFRREECELVFDDGRVVNLLVSATPLPRDDGSPGGCIGVMVDITEQKRIERALISQAEHLQLQAALLANAHDAIIVRDTEGADHLLEHGRRADVRLDRRGGAGPQRLRAARPRRRGARARQRGTRRRPRVAGRSDTSPQGRLDRRRRQPAGARRRRTARPASILEINRDISDRMRAEDQRAELMMRLARAAGGERVVVGRGDTGRDRRDPAPEGGACARRVRRQRGRAVERRHGSPDPGFTRVPGSRFRHRLPACR